MGAPDLHGIQNAQKSPAGGKAEQGDADYHKGKMIELTDRKDPREQNFKGEGRKSDEKNGISNHRQLSASIRNYGDLFCTARSKIWLTQQLP